MCHVGQVEITYVPCGAYMCYVGQGVGQVEMLDRELAIRQILAVATSGPARVIRVLGRMTFLHVQHSHAACV